MPTYLSNVNEPLVQTYVINFCAVKLIAFWSVEQF